MDLVILCIKIFSARIIDVTLGTIRTIYSVKGKTFTAGFIAFFEISIWFMVVREALNTEMTNFFIVISYASGYSVGTILGTYLSTNYINYLISAEIITSKATPENIAKIREEGYGVSIINTTSSFNDTPKNTILLITLNSRYLDNLKNLLHTIDPKAFMVVNEVKVVQNGFIK